MMQNRQYDTFVTGIFSVNAKRGAVSLCVLKTERVKLGHLKF